MPTYLGRLICRSGSSRTGRQTSCTPLADARCTRGLLEFGAKFLKLIAVKITHRQQAKTLIAPAPDVETLHRFELGRWQQRTQPLRYEQVDHVHAAAIDDHRHRLAVDKIE